MQQLNDYWSVWGKRGRAQEDNGMLLLFLLASRSVTLFSVHTTFHEKQIFKPVSIGFNGSKNPFSEILTALSSPDVKRHRCYQSWTVHSRFQSGRIWGSVGEKDLRKTWGFLRSFSIITGLLSYYKFQSFSQNKENTYWSLQCELL